MLLIITGPQGSGNHLFSKIFALSTADLITIEPKSVAEKPFNMPPKLPIGVLTAETMKTLFLTITFFIL